MALNFPVFVTGVRIFRAVCGTVWMRLLCMAKLAWDLHVHTVSKFLGLDNIYVTFQGRIQGGAHPARPSPKIGQNYDFFCVKS